MNKTKPNIQKDGKSKPEDFYSIYIPPGQKLLKYFYSGPPYVKFKKNILLRHEMTV